MSARRASLLQHNLPRAEIEFHGFFRHVQRFLRGVVGLLGVVAEEGEDFLVAVVAFVGGAAFAHGLEELVDGFGDFDLDVPVADVVAGGVLAFEFGDAFGVTDEGADIVEEGIVDVAGFVHGGAAGVETAHFLFDLFEGVGQEDGVVEAFGHLVFAVGTDQACDSADFSGGDGEDATGCNRVGVFGLWVHAAVHLIEPSCDFAAWFDVGELIFADGDEFGAEDEDVGALPDGVHGKAEGVRVAEAFGFEFVLEGGVSHDPVKGQEHGEVPGEFGDGGDFGLEDEGGAVRVDATGEPVLDDFEGALADFVGLVGARGEGVHIGDEEEAVVVVLECDAVFEATDPVAEVESAGGGIAGEDAWFGGHGGKCRGELGDLPTPRNRVDAKYIPNKYRFRLDRGLGFPVSCLIWAWAWAWAWAGRGPGAVPLP